MLHKNKLIELCIAEESGQYGVPYPAEEYDSSKYRYLRITDISDDGCLLDNDLKSVSGDNIDSYILSENDIVFARTGNSTGRSYLYDKRHGLLVFAGFLIRYKIDQSKINPKYLHYFTNSSYYKQWVKNLSNGSTRGNINAQTFADCDIIYPDRQQQDNLVNTLSAIDEKIALNTRMNKELEAMAKQLYDYWFVQFDFPDENGRPYKSSGGKMVYNSTLKREIPTGWEVRNLFYIANYYNGLACQNYRPQEGEDSLPVIKITEMHNGFTSETERASAIIPSEAVIENGDVLFAWSASLEVMLWGLGKGALNQHIFKVTSNNGFPKSFYYFQLMEYVGHFKKIAEAKKTTMGHITKDHLEQSQIVVPPSTYLPNKLEEEIAPLLDKIVSLSSERIYLTHLRDSLLPMLMNGQVTV